MIKPLKQKFEIKKFEVKPLKKDFEPPKKEVFTFEDLKVFVKGLRNATGKVIVTTEDKALQNYLGAWIYKPLCQIIEEFGEPEYIKNEMQKEQEKEVI